jgi:hypothetical protein
MTELGGGGGGDDFMFHSRRCLEQMNNHQLLKKGCVPLSYPIYCITFYLIWIQVFSVTKAFII